MSTNALKKSKMYNKLKKGEHIPSAGGDTKRQILQNGEITKWRYDKTTNIQNGKSYKNGESYKTANV